MCSMFRRKTSTRRVTARRTRRGRSGRMLSTGRCRSCGPPSGPSSSRVLLTPRRSMQRTRSGSAARTPCRRNISWRCPAGRSRRSSTSTRTALFVFFTVVAKSDKAFIRKSPRSSLMSSTATWMSSRSERLRLRRRLTLRARAVRALLSRAVTRRGSPQRSSASAWRRSALAVPTLPMAPTAPAGRTRAPRRSRRASTCRRRAGTTSRATPTTRTIRTTRSTAWRSPRSKSTVCRARSRSRASTS
mmetsp:Transcript_14229/g.42730  ORF Transcript_14229/g.42730 Transcript_14229/m.42730 type:complete len:245 (-) Transcript_14229:461-1195(-)